MRSEISGVAIAIFYFWNACSALAQSGATDNELYAGYCKGALETKIESSKALATDPITEQQRQLVIAPYVKAQKRFQSYLLSTGILTDPQRGDALLGVLIATQRGQSDQKECIAETLADCDPAAVCHVHHDPTPSDPLNLNGPTAAEIQCIGDSISACRAKIPTCVRASRCDGADDLPF